MRSPGLRLAWLLPLVVPVALASGDARAVDPFEIQVYDGGAVDRGHASLEIHVNSVVSGQHEAVPPELPSQHQSHFTAEGAFGIVDWWEAGAYLQTALLPDGSFEYAGAKLRSKFVLPARGASPFRWGLNLEVSRLPERYDPDRWGAEIRPIATWSSASGAAFAAVNPIVDVSLAGPGRSQAPSFEPAATILYVFRGFASLGFEYYANLGPIGDWLPAGVQEHYLYEVINVLRFAHLELNAGVGEGLTEGSNRFVAKMIIGFR
jgi:hypothetical protein